MILLNDFFISNLKSITSIKIEFGAIVRKSKKISENNKNKNT